MSSAAPGTRALENVFPPIPSEVILPFAGYQVSQGALTARLLGQSTLATELGVEGADEDDLARPRRVASAPWPGSAAF